MVDLSHQKINNGSVQGSGKTTFSDISCWLVFGGCLVILLLAYTSFHNRILALSYDIERLRSENTELIQTENALKAEYNLLVNPQEIERVAQNLGLISSNHSEVVILEGDLPRPTSQQVAQSQRQPQVLYE